MAVACTEAVDEPRIAAGAHRGDAFGAHVGAMMRRHDRPQLRWHRQRELVVAGIAGEQPGFAARAVDHCRCASFPSSARALGCGRAERLAARRAGGRAPDQQRTLGLQDACREGVVARPKAALARRHPGRPTGATIAGLAGSVVGIQVREDDGEGSRASRSAAGSARLAVAVGAAAKGEEQSYVLAAVEQPKRGSPADVVGDECVDDSDIGRSLVDVGVAGVGSTLNFFDGAVVGAPRRGEESFDGTGENAAIHLCRHRAATKRVPKNPPPWGGLPPVGLRPPSVSPPPAHSLSQLCRM